MAPISPTTYHLLKLIFVCRQNPGLGLVNRPSRQGHIFLCEIVGRLRLMTTEQCRSFLSIIVDELGADVNKQDSKGLRPLHYVKRADVMSFLMNRGADPLVLDNEGRTVLMRHAEAGNADCVAVLLKHPSVVSLLNTQSTLGTALHMACQGGFTFEPGATTYNVGPDKVVELLLGHGANPFLRDANGKTPLDLFNPFSRAYESRGQLVNTAMEEPTRSFLLAKARCLGDAAYAISKARVDADKNGRTRGDKKQKVLTSTPVYLKDRVEKEEILPCMEAKCLRLNPNSTKATQLAVLRYVLRDKTEFGNVGGMPGDVFVELMQTMCWSWDPIYGEDGV